MGPDWIPQGPCWDPCCSELILIQEWVWSQAMFQLSSFQLEKVLWSGIQFNLSTDWTGWCIGLYDKETIARLVLRFCGFVSRLEEKGRNSFFLRLETAVIAGIRHMLCMPQTWQSCQIFLLRMSGNFNDNIDPAPAKILVDWGWEKRNNLPIYRPRCQKYDTTTRRKFLSLKHQIFTNFYT